MNADGSVGAARPLPYPDLGESLAAFLDRAVISPVLASPACTSQLRTASRRLRARLLGMDQRGQVWFYWKCIRASHWKQVLVEEELQARGLPTLLTVAETVAQAYGPPPEHLFSAAFD